MSETTGRSQPTHPGDPPPSGPLQRFLSGISESIFQGQLGVADVELIDYLSDLLIRFSRIEESQRTRRPDGRPATGIFELLIEAERRIGLARRDVHRQIGDFTLFWSGVYPESVPRQSRGGPDAMFDYFSQGKRAYRIAATIDADESRPPATLLERLAEQFELCAYGLREVRRTWESADPDTRLLLN